MGNTFSLTLSLREVPDSLDSQGTVPDDTDGEWMNAFATDDTQAGDTFDYVEHRALQKACLILGESSDDIQTPESMSDESRERLRELI